MAIRSVAFPLLSGGALLFGYAAFAWLRTKPRALPVASESPLCSAQGEPSLEVLVHVENARTIGASSDEEMEDDEPPSARATHIRALFLARLTEALSPYDRQFALAQVSR